MDVAVQLFSDLVADRKNQIHTLNQEDWEYREIIAKKNTRRGLVEKQGVNISSVYREVNFGII